MRPDHTLQTGFLAALYAYSKESFGQQEIREVIFTDLKLFFKTDEERGLIIVFTAPLEEDRNKLSQQLDITYEQFIKKYEGEIGRGYSDPEIFEFFDKDLLELKIIEKEPIGNINFKTKISFWRKLFRRK
ncbi:MAG: hypothetical protein K9W46_01195 [Candidatus Heimdallarchaeum endolithica]|uniref:Uncharacterized protein n=1 Tax=Candidatus Heimdallarchaeum endolithica TaxID=2876572 RepID=A0A9Y1BRP9_9ARCH|nr:MAG: hypothetical protein K9W46_01195 [Candidatus Heimdallarchaeum endolithica]